MLGNPGNKTERRGPNFDPKLSPSKTPRKRRGPKAQCYCDLPGCTYCRLKAAGRRWYARNRARVLKRHNEYMREVRALKRTPGCWDDAEMDRRALEMLRAEGLR